MAEIVNCSNCRKPLQIPSHYFGEKVQCPQCGHTFIAASSSVSAAPISSSVGGSSTNSTDSPRRSAYDDHDDLPRRRRDRFGEDYDDDHDDYPRSIRQNLLPHRGGLIMALGLVSLVGAFTVGVTLVIGPVAWFMAQSDLRAIRDGQMDPSGESMVRTGQICGMISTGLLALGVVGCGCLFLTGLR